MTESAVTCELVERRREGEAEFVTLRLDASTSGLTARSDLRHDLQGAIRTFQYLADKLVAGLEPADPRAMAKRDSVLRHIATLEGRVQILLTAVIGSRQGEP